ncbi:pyridoxamine 5'-phosphate oxidase family protein [Streptomyces sp. S1A(2023)]
MSDPDPDTELGPFSDSGADATPWPTTLSELQQARLFWLSTVRPDGRPHVTPLLAVWTGGALYFATGDQERKTRNLHGNHHCVMTTGTNVLDGSRHHHRGTRRVGARPDRTQRYRRRLRGQVRRPADEPGRHLVRPR